LSSRRHRGRRGGHSKLWFGPGPGGPKKQNPRAGLFPKKNNATGGASNPGGMLIGMGISCNNNGGHPGGARIVAFGIFYPGFPAQNSVLGGQKDLGGGGGAGGPPPKPFSGENGPKGWKNRGGVKREHRLKKAGRGKDLRENKGGGEEKGGGGGAPGGNGFRGNPMGVLPFIAP